MKITGITATLFRDSLLGPARGCLVEPEIAWAKLASLAEGARLASDQLW